jgi:hypothetical protein
MIKKAFIELVKTAIEACKPDLVEFRHTSTLLDEETNCACYGFTVNGVLFKTGWADTEYYSFVDLHPNTAALSIQDLKLILWWLKEEDTRATR